jgi:hypothetical protein
MAYNFGYPYPNYGQQQMQQLQPQQQQIQNGGFVTVRSEQEARNYPVGYGTSITFRDENAPYIYCKTMGFSQLDQPIFEKYKLVKENAQDPVSEYKEFDNSAFDSIKGEIGNIWKEIDALKKEISDGI